MEKISVFMPCYNAQKYLGQAIESILAQTYPYFELIIVDDGSNDRSREMIAAYMEQDSRVKLFVNECNRGLVYTRNRGIELCRNEYVALMDADDVAPPGRLQTELEFLENNPDIGAIAGKYQLIDDSGCKITTQYPAAFTKSEVRAAMFFQNVIANGSVMYRNEIVKKGAISYRADFGAMEDYCFWCDFLKQSDIVNLNEVLQFYRIHGNSHERITGESQAEKRTKLLDLIHLDLLESAGIQLDKEKERVYLAATHNTAQPGIRGKLALWRAVVQMIKQSKNKDYERELRRMGMRFTLKSRI